MKFDTQISPLLNYYQYLKVFLSFERQYQFRGGHETILNLSFVLFLEKIVVLFDVKMLPLSCVNKILDKNTTFVSVC